MPRCSMAMLSCLSAFALAASGAAQAPTFKVEKFDIKGDGETDYVTATPQPAACSCRARRT